MQIFLSQIEDHPYNSVLCEITSLLRQIKSNGDDFLRKQKNKVQNAFNKEEESGEKFTSAWLDELANGIQIRTK